MPQDAGEHRPTSPMPEQQQDAPGSTAQMDPPPDHGEQSYRGSGQLDGKATLITGADSGIGRAVTIAFAREGADVLISYLSEDDDAQETARWVEQAGRRAVLVRGDIQSQTHCRELVDKAVQTFGRLDVLVNNAAFQRTRQSLDEISAEEWETTFRTNIFAQFYLCQAAVPHMQPGSAIVNTSSIQAKQPSPQLLAYAATKAAIMNFTAGLAGMLAEKGIRVNAVAPGPIWTQLIPATMPTEKVKSFGQQTPMKRPGQPAELAAAYVMLASEGASYISGAMLPVTGGESVL